MPSCYGEVAAMHSKRSCGLGARDCEWSLTNGDRSIALGSVEDFDLDNGIVDANNRLRSSFDDGEIVFRWNASGELDFTRTEIGHRDLLVTKPRQ